MKKRNKIILILLVVGIASAAIGLWFQSEVNRPRITLRPPASPAPWTLSIPEPPNYVIAPTVAEDEEEAGPERIVSLAPSITEIVCALGMRDRLVGRTPYCKYPADIEKVTVVGALVDTNFEKIKSLSPDLVLTTTNSAHILDGLKRIGLRHFAVPHDSLDQVYEAIEQIGNICDRPKTAAQLIKSIRSDIESLRAAVIKTRSYNRRVMIVLGELPVPPKAVWVAGPGSFLDRLVTFSGHTNAVGDALKVSHGEAALEAVRAIDPDIILEFRQHVTNEVMMNVYRAWGRVGDMKAIRNQRVRTIGGSEWLSAGPRIAIALHHIISVLSEED